MKIKSFKELEFITKCQEISANVISILTILRTLLLGIYLGPKSKVLGNQLFLDYHIKHNISELRRRFSG